MKFIALLLVTTISSLAMAQSGYKMTWAVSDAHELPYYNQNGDGIIHALANLVREQGWEIEIIELPRTRIEQTLANLQVDAIAITNPKWLASSDDFVFSDAYAEQPMHLVTRQREEVDDYRQLALLKVVQFAGYRYTAEFEQAERKNTVDIYRPEQGYQMLLSKRADVLVIDGLLFDFAQRRNDALQDLAVSPLVVSVDSMHFGFAQNHLRSAQFMKALNQAIAIFDVSEWLADI